MAGHWVRVTLGPLMCLKLPLDMLTSNSNKNRCSQSLGLADGLRSHYKGPGGGGCFTFEHIVFATEKKYMVDVTVQSLPPPQKKCRHFPPLSRRQALSLQYEIRRATEMA